MTHNSEVSVLGKNLGSLLSACLLLSSCSLSLPDGEEVFRAREAAGGGTTSPGEDAGGQPAEEPRQDGGDPASEPERDGAIADSDAAVGEGDAGQDRDDGGAELPFEPGRGLVLHYRFNESTGNAVHDFAGDKDALVVGKPEGHEQWVSAGRIGGALRLAGGAAPAEGAVGHHVELPPGVLLGLEECSIALWINRSGGPMWQRVFDFGSGQPVWLFFTPHGGTGLPIVAGRTPGLIFVDFVPIEGAPAGEGEIKVTKPIPVSTWVHFVLTWTRDEVKVYLDGSLVGQTVTHGGVTPSDLGNTGQNYLGRSQFPVDPYFNGLIDEFRIYDHALSASDVAELHALQ